MEIVYDVANFKGVNYSEGTTSGEVIQCDNFDATVDNNASSVYHGFLTKFPKSITVGNEVGSQVSRGMFLFKRYDGQTYIQSFSDGTTKYLNSGVWTDILTGESGALPVSYDSFNYIDKVFFSNGNTAIYKYSPRWASAYPIRDKDLGETPLSGTITFTDGSTVVTGVGCSFLTELSTGDWIRKNNTEDWWEVLSVTNDNLLELMTEYIGSTGSSSSSTKARITSLRGKFIKAWKDRLWVASGTLYYALLKEDGDFLLTEFGDKILMEG